MQGTVFVPEWSLFMCGIVGFAGHIPAAPVLLDGLAKLEYRGYAAPDEKAGTTFQFDRSQR